MMDKRAQAWMYREMLGFDSPSDTGAMTAFTKALVICAKGDGVLHEKERDWILGFVSAMGVPAELVELLETYQGDEDLKEVLGGSEATAKHAARELVFDALCACAADGELHPDELASIYKAGEILGLSMGEIRKVEAAWHVSRAAHRNKIATLFPEGTPY